MDERTDTPALEEAPSTYSVISYRASSLPSNYRPMFFSNWLKSLKLENDFFRLIDNRPYYDAYHRYIELLMERPKSQIRLAVLTDEPDTVLGWAFVEETTLHYCFVHWDHRRQGVAKSLIPAPIKTITHLTKDGISYWTRHFPDAKFNPFA
jgi:GNAT superfamily N-acetyltransferase